MRIRREPGLSRCHPTRPPITLLPSIMYTYMRRKWGFKGGENFMAFEI